MVFFFLQNDVSFSDFVKGLSGDDHLIIPDGDFEEPQLFVVIDNQVVMELNSYRKGLFSFFGVHFVFNLEYTKKLKHCFCFIEEYIFGIPQKKGQLNTGKV